MNYLEKALNVRRNELLPASLLSLYLFLMIGTYIMGMSVGDAMFLSAFPRNLPQVMIATALVVGTFASIYIRLSNRVRLELMMVGSLAFFALSFTLFWWLTHFQSKWIYAPIYVWVYMTGAMGPAMGWTLANFLLTTREARRVFGFVGAGAVLGAPTSAFLTATLIHSLRVRPETILLIMAAFLGLCALLVRLMFHQGRERLAEVRRVAIIGKDMPKSFTQIWAYIRRSRYLLLITALICVGCTSTAVIAYQFKIIASASFSNKAALATFFANFNGWMGVAAFFVQMLLTGRLLRSLGIRVTLFVLPVVFLGGSMGVMLAPVLLSAIVLKGSHNLLRFSLDKSSAELLYLPVAPPEIKSQIKSFIDGFVWRTADGIAGLTLLLFANKLHFGPGRISLVNFVFLFTWIAIAYGVRREYLNVLRRAIERRTLDPERTTADVLDSTTMEVLALSLQRGGEQQILYGLSLFEMSRHPGWHPALRGLLENPSPDIRLRALRLLSDAGDHKILARVEKLLADESAEVRAEALHYLVAHTGRDPLSLMNLETSLPDYSVQGSVVAYLARTREPENLAAAQLILAGMLSRTDDQAVRARAEAARNLGIIPPPSDLHKELFRLLEDSDGGVVEQALLAGGKTQSRELLPLVIEKLSQPRLLGAARAALAEYGEKAVGTLKDYLNDASIAMGVRKQIPAVLARIATSESIEVLIDSLLQSDPGLRYDLVKALNKVRRLEPRLIPESEFVADMINAELMGYFRSLQILEAFDPAANLPTDHRPSELLLTRALRECMEYEMERIFRLLALLHPPQDIHNVYVGLQSNRPQVRANSLEVLEQLLRPELFRPLAQALDPEINQQERLRFAQRFCHAHVASRTEALRILLKSDDHWLRACALHAIGNMALTELQGEIQRMTPSSDPVLEETWQWTKTRLQAGAAV